MPHHSTARTRYAIFRITSCCFPALLSNDLYSAFALVVVFVRSKWHFARVVIKVALRSFEFEVMSLYEALTTNQRAAAWSCWLYMK